jgi:hypothetical protein
MRRPRLRSVSSLLTGAAALIAALLLPVLAAASSAALTSAAAGTSSSKVPRYDHITVFMFTEHGYDSILHNRYAPTFNRLAEEYGLATHYYTDADPDAPNVMALLAGNTYGVTDHDAYWDQQIDKPSLLSELANAHLTWKEYVQNLPYAGYLGNCYPTQCQETDTLYKQPKFNPLPDLASVAGNPAQARNMVPASRLATDARDGRLPTFSLVMPNECTNMHGGPPWCVDSPNRLGQHNDNLLVSDGDAYLEQVTTDIMSGPQWHQKGNDAIVITWTEGLTQAGCCDLPGTGKVFTVVVTNHGPRHMKDATPFDHYSLLATIQHAFGLGCLQHSCDTKHVIPMAKLFGGKSDGPIPWPAGSDAAAAAAGVRAAARRDAASTRAETTVASSWKEVPTPDTGPSDNDLWAVSGSSADDVWAVGSLLPNATATVVQTLALHYDGANWTRVPTPDYGSEANSFYAVTTLPDATAWATGIYTTAAGRNSEALTEHWNGSRWTVVPAADPGSFEDVLYGAAAVTDDEVWAVGAYAGPDGFFHPLLELWNGKRWSVVPIDGLGTVNGILSAVSTGRGGVWAVGQVSDADPTQQLVVHLVGTTWQVVSDAPVRTPGGAVASAYPTGISSSAKGVWVAGDDRSGDEGFSTLVEATNGATGLGQLRSPDPTEQDNYLQAVAAVHAGADAWAVGDDVPPATGTAVSLIEYGSATSGWKVVPSPNPGAKTGTTILDGVFAVSTDDVWAVGKYTGPTGMRTLALHYTG